MSIELVTYIFSVIYISNKLNPRLDCFNNTKFRVEFNRGWLKPANIPFALDKTINLYIAFEMKSWPFYVDNDFTLINSLFGAVKMTKNADPDSYPG